MAMMAGVIDKMGVTPVAAAIVTMDCVRHMHMRVVGGFPDFGRSLMAGAVVWHWRGRRHGERGTGSEAERESQQTGANTGIHLSTPWVGCRRRDEFPPHAQDELCVLKLGLPV